MKTRITYDDWADVTLSNPVASQMKMAQEMTQAVVSGGLQIAYLSGPPGVGKNIAVRRALKGMSAPEPVKANPTNYRDLLTSIQMARQRSAILWMDEADVIFRSERMINLIKTATGRKEDRHYNRVSVDVPMIVSTNASLDQSQIKNWWKSDLVHHAEALFNRSPPVVIPNDQTYLWEYSVNLAVTTSMLWSDDDGDGICMSHRQEAVNWFTENVYRLDVVSPRTLYEAANLLNRSRKAQPRISATLASAMLNAKLTRSSDQPPPPNPIIPLKKLDD